MDATTEKTEKSRFYPNEYDWWELPEECAKCRQPFHVRSGQEFPFCPNCVIDRRNAKNGREALAVAKGRFLITKTIEADRIAEEQRKRQEDGKVSSWPANGLPL